MQLERDRERVGNSMEDNLANGISLAVTHLLQQTLRSICLHENSQWVYAVFWRILPRNYPPPKWDFQAGPYDRLRGNRRNWILVWEDGFCNFSAAARVTNGSDSLINSSTYTNIEYNQHLKSLQPELFFKMSHEIYNYGEGLIGKVAADHNHKWIFREPNDSEVNLMSAWHNPTDSYPRTWESQFRAGIQTIALIAVREGVLQLGAVNKVVEDINYIFLLRKKFNYIDSIPGALLPHPSSAAFPLTNGEGYALTADSGWSVQANPMMPAAFSHGEYSDYLALGSHLHGLQELKITPSMTSLEALLSKLPSVDLISSDTAAYVSSLSMGKAKIEKDEDYGEEAGLHLCGESSSSMCSYHQH